MKIKIEMEASYGPKVVRAELENLAKDLQYDMYGYLESGRFSSAFAEEELTTVTIKLVGDNGEVLYAHEGH